ncbi:histidine phosphatase family protein [Paenibacillus donghaensis]|uniref:Histidine phosphatase family protein n=1 Tax=Paenibacillus donghaensis TaxID=414771 RepID=A0A2Z2K8I9_9BACL|nr:histidine phosphatase family protein [Paenibacillus donghaensis]ASA19605.1 hypothetical protein B9T62_01480 [Paenibacillus donghaensis]
MEHNKRTEPEADLELSLLRHGQTRWNAERRYLGHTDLPLFPGARDELLLRRDQPELSASFWRVYCSDLLRCRETLACVAPELISRARYDLRLRELNFGAWEGCTYEQLQHNKQYRSWVDDPAAVTPPKGEAWGAFTARLQHFLDELGQAAEQWHQAHQDHQDHQDHQEHQEHQDHQTHPVATQPLRVLIVTHGGVIRQLRAWSEAELSFYNAPAPPPGGITTIRLRMENGNWRF